jgi:hypothetical protein
MNNHSVLQFYNNNNNNTQPFICAPLTRDLDGNTKPQSHRNGNKGHKWKLITANHVSRWLGYACPKIVFSCIFKLFSVRNCFDGAWKPVLRLGASHTELSLAKLQPRPGHIEVLLPADCSNARPGSSATGVRRPAIRLGPRPLIARCYKLEAI